MQYRSHRSRRNIFGTLLGGILSGQSIYCGCMAVVALINLSLGAISVNYLLQTFTEKVLPFFWAMVIGLFVGELSMPAAVIVWILKKFGVF